MAAPPDKLAAADDARDRLAQDLQRGLVRPNCPLLVHSSLSAVGGGAALPGGADTVIDALMDAVGAAGTLCFPTLSYLFTTIDSPSWNAATTRSNVGVIAETFRNRPEVQRSVHPTHSCAALGVAAVELTRDHHRDCSPVGPHSPFRKIRDLDGQIAFLGSVLTLQLFISNSEGRSPQFSENCLTICNWASRSWTWLLTAGAARGRIPPCSASKRRSNPNRRRTCF